MKIDFETAFGDFIDRHEYDEAENALFAMVRISFMAGWKAAGGDPLKPQEVFMLPHREKYDPDAFNTNLKE